MGILKHHTQGTAQIALLDLVDIDTVIPDLAVLNIIKSVNQVRDRRLAGAGTSYESNLLTRFGIHRNVMQYNLVVRISEIHIVKSHMAFLSLISNRPVCPVRMFPGPDTGPFRALCQSAVRVFFRIDQFHITVVGLRRLVHQLEHTGSARHGHDDIVHLLADLSHRLGKVFIQRQERNQRAKRQPPESSES